MVTRNDPPNAHRTDAERERFAALLATGTTITDAAVELGISRKTATRWRQDPVVLDALALYRSVIRDETTDRLSSLTRQALDRAEEILNDHRTPVATVVRLIGLILSEGRIFTDLGEFSDRLVRLEGGRYG